VNDPTTNEHARARKRGHRRWPLLGVAGLLVIVSAACVDPNTNSLLRPDEPVVMTGSQLAGLVGANPNQIVAFAHSRPGGTPSWTQIPVQIDQRKIVDFGQQPGSNATPGTDGTVYGTTPIGVTALQYADANTFVGADSDATFDADDELVFMSSDAGGSPNAAEQTVPAGMVPGSGVRVELTDPLVPGRKGVVYLFRASAAADPSAGRDYVDYDFNLTSGAYKTTYKRADGPNAETSLVTTDNYRIGFDDRWIENEWRVDAGGGTGVDILDGVQARFGLATCGRSNVTFADGEGAFIANIDGPVRAIRSYVGANSGPLTQRTHILYRDRESTTTNLRVHAIPGIMDYADYSTTAIGMTYANSAHPEGVPIDGVADAISTATPTWELVTGEHGSVLVAGQVDTTVIPAGGTIDDVVDGFYRDELNSPVQQCWGDAHFLGASGLNFPNVIANTDPTLGAFARLDAVRTVKFAPPGATTAEATAFGHNLVAPLQTLVMSYTP
jgi:hypothetical protein